MDRRREARPAASNSTRPCRSTTSTTISKATTPCSASGRSRRHRRQSALQSKNKMQQEFGPAYVEHVRHGYPDVPGRADYCVYWFRKAHDDLPLATVPAWSAPTPSARTSPARAGSITSSDNGGTITEAVSTQAWSGDAVVHVCHRQLGQGRAARQEKAFYADWRPDGIARGKWSRWTDRTGLFRDVRRDAGPATAVNIDSGACYQGQTHGHEGFLLTGNGAREDGRCQ